MKTLIIVLWILQQALSAQATVLKREAAEVNLVQAAHYLEDASGSLTFDDVRALDRRFESWTKGGNELNFGFTTSTYWIRLPLQRLEDAPKDWLLTLDYLKFYELDLYLPSGKVIQTGSSRDFDTRPYFDRFFVFPVEISVEKEHFYIRAKSKYTLSAPINIWQPESFRKQQQRFQFLQFSYYGAFIILALYGLVIYISITDIRFLIYTAYIITLGLGIFSSNGYGRQLLWPDAAVWDEISQNSLYCLAAFFAISFARKFLILSNDSSVISKALQLNQFLFLLIFSLTLLEFIYPGSQGLANQMLLISSVTMGLLVSFACFRAYFKKLPAIRFFLAGWLTLLIGVTIATLRAFGLIAINDLTSYPLQLATAVEVLMMALALGDILRIEQKNHIKTQEIALSNNRALLEASQESEKNLQQAVKERTAQLQTLFEAEKKIREQYVRFGSLISHEFRTPLNIIQTQTSLLRKEYEHGMNQVLKRSEVIASATQRLKTMFDKWLQSDAITQSLESIDYQQIRLKPWIHEFIQSNSHLLLNHSVKFRLDPEIDYVMGDQYHLEVALSNLIDNAAKYSPIGSDIIIKTQRVDDRIGISVSDFGQGIPLEVHDLIFSDFFRLSSSTSIQGSGLGLSIVHRIASAHGGSVDVSSVPGNGATFCIWLPAN